MLLSLKNSERIPEKKKSKTKQTKENKTGYQVRGPRPHLLRMGAILVPRDMVDVGKFGTKTQGFWCRTETDSNLPLKVRRRFPNFSKSAFPLFSVNYCTSFSSGHNVTVSLPCCN